MFTVLYFAYVFMVSLVLLPFFYIINVCHNLFKEMCKYIMYYCRIMLIVDLLMNVML